MRAFSEGRIDLSASDWLPAEVRERLRELNIHSVNKNDELIVTAQEYRTQRQNRELCVTKLREMVEFASIEPKDRNMWTVRFKLRRK